MTRLIGTGVPFFGTSSPKTILERQASSDAAFSSTQTQVDGMVSSFIDQASDWKSLAAMMAGGLAYRFGKIGFLSLGARASSQSPLVTAVVRGGSIAFGLSSEVTVFEFTNRTLQTFFESPITGHRSPNLWAWSGPQGFKQGWLSSFVNFGTLKGFGRLAGSQNLILQHGVQDFGMVLGHHLAFRVGFGERPEGSLSEQLLHAEATNLQLAAGTHLAHTLSGGKLLAMEKGLDLALSSQENSFSRQRKVLSPSAPAEGTL